MFIILRLVTLNATKKLLLRIASRSMILRKICRSTHLLSYCFFKQPEQFLRNSSYLPQIQIKSVLIDKSKYELIYDFPAIKFTAAILRTRLSFPIITVVSVPFFWFFDTSWISTLACFVSAGIHFLLVTLISKFTQNIVGKIYVNKEGDVQDLIISSLDRFGRRTDRNHKLNDIINCDFYNNFSRRMGFISLFVENSDINYYVNISQCKVYNAEICNYLFGRTWHLKTKSELNENKCVASNFERQK